jgi:hypothetical protein
LIAVGRSAGAGYPVEARAPTMMKERRHDDSRAETRRVIVGRLTRHAYGITIRQVVWKVRFLAGGRFVHAE